MKKVFLSLAVIILLATPVFSSDCGYSTSQSDGKICEGFGPQTPRDIDSTTGKNKISFEFAPPASEMHLCNVHFHENAEHKAKDFSIYAGDGHEGYDSGYKCTMGTELSTDEMAWSSDGVCKGSHGDLIPGDTIEVHWVYTTCPVSGGPTLGSCVSGSCANPQLRVIGQVFILVAKGGLDFTKLKEAKDLPSDTGTPIEFIGSTTGPKYSASNCSPYQVTWSVRPKCAKLNINSIGLWCKDNIYDEDHAHGVRALVTNPELLAPIH